MGTRDRRENGISFLTRKRLFGLTVFFGCVFLIFTGILFRYQILGSRGQKSFVLPAFRQRQKGVPIGLPRANITDRNGVPIHAPSWDTSLLAFPDAIRDKEGTAVFLSGLLGEDPKEILNKISVQDSPVKIKRELPWSVIQTLLESPKEGLHLIPEERRYGPSSLACHVVGHVRPNGYFDPKDALGESGLEKMFQESLSGEGYSWVGVVTSGQGDLLSPGIQVGNAGIKAKDLTTTLDLSVQKALEDALDKCNVKKGAGVVLDVKTGEILGLASRPVFDQNHPEKSIDDAANAPFVNRAISAFPPGSTWKPVVAALALEKGIVTPKDTFECKGPFKVGDRTVKCGGAEKGHGKITLGEALAKSCNFTISRLALELDPQELVGFALKCGFGERTGVLLPDESSGVLPDPKRMLPGDVVNFAMGQGYLTVTPLQMAAFFRAIVCRGLWAEPSIIPKVQLREKRIFSERTAKTLEEALLLTTSGHNVTGNLAWVKGYGSAGKTGTAEVSGEGAKTHAWFLGWTPIIAPKYVISVIVEEGGEGPQRAAPLFREIAERILYPGDIAP